MSNKNSEATGLRFPRQFTKEGISPFDMFEYDYRTSIIKNTTGEIVFQMDNVEVPKQWSQIATDILAQKYFRKAGVPQADGNTGRETSVKQVAHRMAHCWRVWGERYHYFGSAEDAQVFYEELVYGILNQSCVPNSPQWFNTGLHEVYGITGKPQGHYFVDANDGQLKKSTSAYERPQPHACARYNTRLFTNKGILQIGEIVEDKLTGLEVFDGKGFVKILAVKNNGIRSIFRATFNNGNFIEFTGDHQIWSSDKRKKDGGIYHWQELNTLIGKKVQQTAFTNVIPELELVTEMAAEASATNRIFQLPREILQTARETGNNENLLAYTKAALAGWIVGDGYYGKYNRNNNTTLFGAITINEDEYAFVTNLFETIFGKYTTVTRKSVNDLYRIVKLDSKVVDGFVGEYELNQSSLSANIPEKIMTASIGEKCMFLRSLFQADGCVRTRDEDGRNSGDIVLTSISEELVHGVQMLLLTLGIYSNISKSTDPRDNRHDLYQLTIAYESERKKYAQLIGFISAEKTEKLNHLNSRIAGKQKKAVTELTVMSIDYIGDETVYDIQTETS
nr:hypothetical protein [Bacteroidota bacterium]